LEEREPKRFGWSIWRDGHELTRSTAEFLTLTEALMNAARASTALMFDKEHEPKQRQAPTDEAPAAPSAIESNVELYLSKAYASRDEVQRDALLRLLVKEEARMGLSRENLENGRRRLEDCKERVQRQREAVLALRPGRSRLETEFVLETFEKTLLLMEQHQQVQVELFQMCRL
jgi:hypothetical protein